MNSEEAKDLLDNLIGMVEDNQNNDYDEALKLGIEALEKQINGGWIPIKTRPMTSEECEEYEVDDGYIYDCPLPDNGDEVLISTKWGVEKTTFYTDDGYYFECYEYDGDVLAWMPLPEPYKEEGDGE